MARKRGGITAEELIKELEADPDYVRGRQARMEESLKASREYQAAAAPILAELAEAGIHLTGAIGNLRFVEKGANAALPVLTRWLYRDVPKRVMIGMIWALSGRWARPESLRILLDKFHTLNRENDPEPDSVRLEIANSIEIVANDSVSDRRTCGGSRNGRGEAVPHACAREDEEVKGEGRSGLASVG